MSGSRWVRSDVTFGPVGRLVATGLALAPVWWFVVYGGVFGIVGLIVWVPFLLPWVLRDIWRRVPDGRELPHLSWPDHDADGGIEERRGPSRW